MTTKLKHLMMLTLMTMLKSSRKKGTTKWKRSRKKVTMKLKYLMRWILMKMLKSLRRKGISCIRSEAFPLIFTFFLKTILNFSFSVN